MAEKAFAYLLSTLHENGKEEAAPATFQFTAAIMLEADVYVFIPSDMGKGALGKHKIWENFISGFSIPLAEIFLTRIFRL